MITDRIQAFGILFDELQCTNSRLKKDYIIEEFKRTYPELQEDWIMILETLDGKHPIGWTLHENNNKSAHLVKFVDIASVIRFLEGWKDYNGLSTLAIRKAENEIGEITYFIAPIVNRTLRLGIGKSLLSKSDYTPMLAKKYEGQSLLQEVIVTEKLDGNRCITYWDDDRQEWIYKSRSGKPVKVNLDMTDLPKEFIYDGEIMSETQTLASINRTGSFLHDIKDLKILSNENAQLEFNRTSGLINRKGTKRGLIYNIFDIVSDEIYEERRRFLDTLCPVNPDLRILPTLYNGNNEEIINDTLDIITSMGGEGIMLNIANRKYDHKRSDALLKYKQVQTADMIVLDTFEGKGKYEGQCGGLTCYMRTSDNKEVRCDVGSGLSDVQRYNWGINPKLIVGKIVEVAYHELTQDQGKIGTKLYSLRFPRLKKVRLDKDVTGEY